VTGEPAPRATTGVSRIEEARQRVARTKRVVALGAVAAFAVTVPLARATNPGHASSGTSRQTTTSDDGSGLSGIDGYGDQSGQSGQISPSSDQYSGPSAQTGVS
jgi:hypothetical protein